MINNLLNLFSDIGLYRDLIFLLFLLLLFSAPFMWRQQRQAKIDLFNVFQHGLWSSTHQTANAGKTNSYFDADLFLTESENIGTTLKWVKEELKNTQKTKGKIDRLAFVEKSEGPVGVITLQGLLCLEADLPGALIRLRRNGPAMKIKAISKNATQRKALFCADGKPEKIVLLSDVVTTGTTILSAVNEIKKHGGVVSAVYVLYDREDLVPGESDKITGSQLLKREGIEVSSMRTAKELLAAAEKDKELLRLAKKKGVVATA